MYLRENVSQAFRKAVMLTNCTMFKDNPYISKVGRFHDITSSSVSGRREGPHAMVTTLDSWARLFKAQLSQPTEDISENFDFRFVTFH